MKSYATSSFWSCFDSLPPEIQGRARSAYEVWQRNPRHPSLRFKKIGSIWSIRIGNGYRALAFLQDDGFYWFWIGNHADYERMIRDA